MTTHLSPFLRNVLLLDAAASAAAGLVMSAGAGPLGSLTGLPTGLLLWAGLVLLPWAAALGLAAGRAALPRLIVFDIALVNGLWATGSLGLVLSRAVVPNGLGLVFVILQALAVALFAGLQLAAFRRSAAPNL